MKKLIVGGACGKMGKTIIDLAEKHDLTVVCGVDEKFSGQNCNAETVCEYPINEDNFFKYSKYSAIGVKCDVIVDFSSPIGTVHALEYAVSSNTPIVVAATGLSPEQLLKVNAAANKIPVVYSENYSFGVNAFVSAAKALVKPLSDYDVYIEEIHHSQKKDSPSGTAKLIKRAVESATDKHAPILSMRGGDIKGIHSVYVLGKNEMIEMKHTAFSRGIFADGALICARRLIGMPPKLYRIEDFI